ncbi:MAG: PIN domain nuclease [Acidimicrobiales bacterium]
MILVDTSAWVEYDRATGSAVHHILRDTIADGGTSLASTDPVLMEVLAGARDERRASDLRRLLTSFAWVRADPVADFEGAAKLYRQCRSRGLTPRGLIDCMIATIAMRTRVQLLAADRDFDRMARIVPLQVVAW